MNINHDFLKEISGFPALRGEKIDSKVSTICIEISGRCNAKCPYCARRRFHERYSGDFMSPFLFEKILKHLIEINLINKHHNKIIHLYNWGEAFLNPDINEILSILRKYNFKAGVSSNFIKMPVINNDVLPVLGEVTFSLSGFSQETYGKIHGAKLNLVLNNFEKLYDKIQKFSPNTNIIISWHRYKFNETELWDAFQYFKRPGVFFCPSIAYFNDLPEMLNYVEGSLSKERIDLAQDQMHLEHISQSLNFHRLRSKKYLCFMWNFLVIDEYGQLVLCCGMTNKDHQHTFKNVLELSYHDIWKNKLSDTICEKCILSGLPRSLEMANHMNLPPIGVIKKFEFWKYANLSSGLLLYFKIQISKMIRNYPLNGEFYFRRISNFKSYLQNAKINFFK